jgi:hypothetical protein
MGCRQRRWAGENAAGQPLLLTGIIGVIKERFGDLR